MGRLSNPALENQLLKAWNVLARRQISTHLIHMKSRPHITLFSAPSLPRPLQPPLLLLHRLPLRRLQPPLPLPHSHHSSPSLPVSPPPEYSLDSWIPLCSVAQHVPKPRMAEAFCVLRDLKLPVSGYAVDIGLVEFSPVRELFSFELGNAVES